MNIGKNLQKARKNANLKQEELASLINVSPKTISSWENNRNLPSIEMIILIANTLNIKIDDIISDKNEAVKIYSKKELQRNTFIFFIILILPLIFSIVSAYDALNIQSSINNELQTSLKYFIIGNKNNFILYILIQIINYILFILKKSKALLIFSIIEFLLLIFSFFTLKLIYTPTIIFISLLTTLICFTIIKKSN